MTQLAPRTESFGAGDQSWLASRDGTETPQSVTLDPSAWTAKLSGGRLKSGEAYAAVAGLAVPYNSSGNGGTNVLAGFILTDQHIRSDGGRAIVPAIRRGHIKLSKLPSTVAANATTTGLFIWEA